MRRLSLFHRYAALVLVTLTAMPFTASLTICPLTELLAAASSVRLVSRETVMANLQHTALDAAPSGAIVTTRQDGDLVALTDVSAPHPGGTEPPPRAHRAAAGPRLPAPPLIPLRI